MESAGSLALVEGAPAYATLAADLAAQGVIFTDLATALREHEGLVQRHFGRAVAIDENKFSVLHYALWRAAPSSTCRATSPSSCQCRPW